jgi:hypothetical protein
MALGSRISGAVTPAGLGPCPSSVFGRAHAQFSPHIEPADRAALRARIDR